MSHEELQELLALYALDTLDPSEAFELEAHLATCESCPAELDELRNTAGSIGLAVAPVAPPAELRGRILAQVGEPRPAERPTAEVIRPPARFWRPVAALATLAAAAAIVALSMYALGLAERVRTIEGQLAEKQNLADFLASADTATIVLAGTDEAPKARLKLAYDRRTGHALLFGYDLPQPPAGKAYQLWFISGGKPLPGRVFDPGAAGHGWWPEEVPADGRDASIFAVTLEPADGVSSPTGPMFLKSVSLS